MAAAAVESPTATDGSYAKLLDELDSIALQEQTWKGSIPFLNEFGELIDLVNYLSTNKTSENFFRSLGYPPNTRFRFPEEYYGMENSKKLVEDIINAAAKINGQNLSTRGSDKDKKSAHRLYSIVIGCHRYFTQRNSDALEFEDGKFAATGTRKTSVHQSKTKKKNPKKRKTTSSRPASMEEICTFHIVIFLGPDNRWYLSTMGYRKSSKYSAIECRQHCGHPPIESAAMNPGTRTLSEDVLELRSQMEKAGCTHSEQARVVSVRTGHQWTPEQMRYLSDKEREEISALSPDASSADKLVEMFRKRCVCCLCV